MKTEEKHFKINALALFSSLQNVCTLLEALCNVNVLIVDLHLHRIEMCYVISSNPECLNQLIPCKHFSSWDLLNCNLVFWES